MTTTAKNTLRWIDIPPFTKGSSYSVDCDWSYIKDMIDDYTKHESLDFNPDFQRAHVWTVEQQRAFVEFGLRGGKSGMDIYFNCPGWMKGTHGRMEVVDGKQRLTAVLDFMSDKFRIFPDLVPGGLLRSEFTGPKRIHLGRFHFHVNDLQTRQEVIRWYLEMNSGGTPHTKAELDEAARLLAEAQMKGI